MWVLILFILLMALLLIGLNQVMIKTFYWGPSGKPPRFKRAEKKQDAPESEGSVKP